MSFSAIWLRNLTPDKATAGERESVEDPAGLLVADGSFYGTKWISHGVTVHLNVSQRMFCSGLHSLAGFTSHDLPV